VTDPTEYAELRELAESVQIELDAIAGDLFDRIGDLETLRRKINNIGENLAELLGERVRPAVLDFNEVDR
jgi:hypothetical protein